MERRETDRHFGGSVKKSAFLQTRGKVKEISQRNDKRLFEELLWKSHTKAAEKRLQPIASVLRNDLLHGGYGAFDHAVVRLFC